MKPDQCSPTVVRKRLGLTQKQFACVLGVSCRTVEAWDAGRATPSPTAKRLLFLLATERCVLERLIKLSEQAPIQEGDGDTER